MACLPPLAEDADLAVHECRAFDVPVLRAFQDSSLAPLLPMARSDSFEVRRGAITSLAMLSENELRAFTAALRNLSYAGFVRTAWALLGRRAPRLAVLCEGDLGMRTARYTRIGRDELRAMMQP